MSNSEGSGNERKKEPTPPPKVPETESTSSREMCAYCDAALTVSSKFYNISTVGDLEYIGRRSNHLGPKKHTFCDRVCKRHYDLNLKRDKAQRQFNAKRERLPGIDVIFGFTKKSRTDPTVTSHNNTRSQASSQPQNPAAANMGEFSTVTSYNWHAKMSPVPGVSGGPMITTMSTGPPVVTMVKPHTEKWKVDDWQIHTTSWRHVQQQPNPPSSKETENSFTRAQLVSANTSAPPPTNEGIIKFHKWEKPKQSPDSSQSSAGEKPNGNEMDDKAKDNSVVLFDCILQQMETLLSLFPVDRVELSNSFSKTRTELVNNKTDITSAIASLYSETTRTVQAFLQFKEEQQSKINSSVNDLMVLLLKREKKEYLIQDNDVNAIFIDWVEIQKQNMGNMNTPSPQDSESNDNVDDNQMNNDNPQPPASSNPMNL